MKKTKLLIVIALAVLATLAMSACGLIVNSVSDIEFVKMPKTYYSVDEIKADGMSLELNVVMNGEDKPITVKVTFSEDGTQNVTINGLTDTEKTALALNVGEVKTTMGQHDLTINASGIELTAQYRVCELIDGEDATAIGTALKTALGTATNVTGYYMLAGNAHVDRVQVKRPFILYGEGYSVIKNAADSLSDDERIVDISGTYSSNLDSGLFEFNNVTFNVAEGTTTKRGVSVYDVTGATINFNACAVYGATHYSINIASKTEGLTVNISNGTWSSGWAAFQCFAKNSVVNIDSVELIGVNDKTDADTNQYGTFVLGTDGDNYCANTTFNVTNTKIVAVQKENVVYATQDHIMIQSKAVNNVVNFVNCMYSTKVVNGRGVEFNPLRSESDEGLRIWSSYDASNIITIK